MKKICVMIITFFYLTVIQPGNALAAPIIVDNGTLQSVNQIAMSVMSRDKNYVLVSATPNVLTYNYTPADDFFDCTDAPKDFAALKGKFYYQLVINTVENTQKKIVVNAALNAIFTDAPEFGTGSRAIEADWVKHVLFDIKSACDGMYVYGFKFNYDDNTTITDVTPGKAFAKAGIEPNSKIISINGKNATTSVDVLGMRLCPTVTLVVEKDGKQKTVQLKGELQTPEEFRAERGI